MFRSSQMTARDVPSAEVAKSAYSFPQLRGVSDVSRVATRGMKSTYNQRAIGEELRKILINNLQSLVSQQYQLETLQTSFLSRI